MLQEEEEKLIIEGAKNKLVLGQNFEEEEEEMFIEGAKNKLVSGQNLEEEETSSQASELR